MGRGKSRCSHATDMQSKSISHSMRLPLRHGFRNDSDPSRSLAGSEADFKSKGEGLIKKHRCAAWVRECFSGYEEGGWDFFFKSALAVRCHIRRLHMTLVSRTVTV